MPRRLASGAWMSAVSCASARRSRRALSRARAARELAREQDEHDAQVADDREQQPAQAFGAACALRAAYSDQTLSAACWPSSRSRRWGMPSMPLAAVGTPVCCNVYKMHAASISSSARRLPSTSSASSSSASVSAGSATPESVSRTDAHHGAMPGAARSRCAQCWRVGLESPAFTRLLWHARSCPTNAGGARCYPARGR